MNVTQFWADNNVISKHLNANPDGPIYSFYDGPPFATGKPHFGHLLAGTIKDVMCRFAVARGYRVNRRFGWDCHGVPIEQIVSKAFSTSVDIQTYSNKCREVVVQCENDWRTMVQKSARWVEPVAWKTMDTTYMESVWWTFALLYKKNLAIEGYRVSPYSVAHATTLSNFESNDYREVTDVAAEILWKLDNVDAYILTYTTTPYTLHGNVACAVHKTIQYVIYSINGKKIIAREHYAEQGVPIDIHTLLTYTYNGGRPILHGDFVCDADTGVVHCAPAFGVEDFELTSHLLHGPPPCVIDAHGYFPNGVFYRDATDDILREYGDAVHASYPITHRVQHCYRSHTPLMYRAVNSWLINVPAIRERMLELNEQINWMPSHVGKNRFADWVASAHEWCVSRSRTWGTPIPVWKSLSGKIIVIESIAQLKEYSGVHVTDLHRDVVDSITFTHDGETYSRINDVFDCWFESGCMPWASVHYPFENETLFKRSFPADFVAEGLDQTRGWFYTMLVLSTALFDSIPFKNVIVNGLVLGENGEKMSKSRGTWDVNSILDEYTPDAVRLYLLSTELTAGEPLKFCTIALGRFKRVIKSLQNIHYTSYVRNMTDELAMTFLSRTNKFLKDFHMHLMNHKLWLAVDEIMRFVPILMTVKNAGYHCILMNAIELFARATSCMMPYTSEMLYLYVNNNKSVFEQMYPVYTIDDCTILEDCMSVMHHITCENTLVFSKHLPHLKYLEELRDVKVTFEDSPVTMKPNYAVCGKRLGKDAKVLANILLEHSLITEKVFIKEINSFITPDDICYTSNNGGTYISRIKCSVRICK